MDPLSPQESLLLPDAYIAAIGVILIGIALILTYTCMRIDTCTPPRREGAPLPCSDCSGDAHPPSPPEV